MLHAIYEQIVVTGRTIVSIRLTPAAYAHGRAVALPTKVALARPTGFKRADAISIQIPIEGAERWGATIRNSRLMRGGTHELLAKRGRLQAIEKVLGGLLPESNSRGPPGPR